MDPQADLGENLFHPLAEGYGQGGYTRDVSEEAIDWWERELAAMEQELAETRRR